MSSNPTITISAAGMTRLAEVVSFADQRAITVEAAIVRLVNQGLSHQ